MYNQLYSGNLEAYKWAVKRLYDAGVKVEVSNAHYDPKAMAYNKSIELYEPRGPSDAASLAMRTFWHGDIDILYITITEWLHQQAAAYESWK